MVSVFYVVFITTCTSFCDFRGDSFRAVLERIGEVHSILQQGINVMALTVTVTQTVRFSLSKIIGMRHPFVLAISPCESNIMYSVGSFESVEVSFKPLAERLKSDRTNIPQTIIYGRTFNICADIFMRELGESITEPIDAPDISTFRLVNVFTSVTDQHQKENIVYRCIY